MSEGRCRWDDNDEALPGSQICQMCFNDTTMTAMELASEFFPSEWLEMIEERRANRRPTLVVAGE